MIQKENSDQELPVVLPIVLSTTDDITLFAFEGKVDSIGNDYYIINKDDDTGTRSTYTKTTSSTDSLRGIRIRHSVTFNAVGNAAPMYATVYGLSEDELPTSTCPSGAYDIPLEGFCYGGMQDCSNKTVGYLVFLRNTNKEDDISTDQLNHMKYRNEVFLPYVQKTRENYLQQEEWRDGDDVDEEHTWVAWMVRENVQLLIQMNIMYHNNKHTLS